MNALLSAENDLTNEEIIWAIHNLPDEGTNNYCKFDHSKDDIYEACGYFKKDIAKARDELKNILDSVNGRNSNYIEVILLKGSPLLLNFLIIRGLLSLASKPNDGDDPLDRLMKLLDKL